MIFERRCLRNIAAEPAFKHRRKADPLGKGSWREDKIIGNALEERINLPTAGDDALDTVRLVSNSMEEPRKDTCKELAAQLLVGRTVCTEHFNPLQQLVQRNVVDLPIV